MGRNTVAAPVAASSFSTTFSGTETPISEGGAWVKLTPEGGAADHNGWHGVVTSGGNAMPRYNAGAAAPDYDDCYAYLAGTWPTDLRAEATVYRGTGIKEVELLFRFADQNSPANARGYECLFDIGAGTSELNRWNGAPDGWENLAADSPGTWADGDRVAATCTGTNPVVITRYYSRAATPTTWVQIGSPYSDSTAGRFTDGAPGIGFFARSGESSLDYGFKDYSVVPI